jgi:hypothetical protein
MPAEKTEPVRIEGKINLLLLAGIMAAMLSDSGCRRGWIDYGSYWLVLLMVVMAFL